MFTRVTAFFVMALPILATAIALEAHNDCDTGAVQCCASVQTTNSTDLAEALAGAGLLGVGIDAIINDIDGLVGIACAPLSFLSLTGNFCSTQPVCCTNNFIGGLIQAGCTPVNINA